MEKKTMEKFKKTINFPNERLKYIIKQKQKILLKLLSIESYITDELKRIKKQIEKWQNQ
jgi:hypothetical protein